jgi:hypothetical protein
VVIDANFGDDGREIGLPRLHVGGFELLPDQIHEGSESGPGSGA